MERNWQPKYKVKVKVKCPNCGWTGKRTKRMRRKPCPKCGHYYPVEEEQ